MSSDEATENPNDKMPAGKPLDPNSAVPEGGDREAPAGLKDLREDGGTPGHQERPMTEDEKLEKSLEDTFPTSDPIQPSRIDGPNN